MGTWPPTPDDIYLSEQSARPLFQGDVFRDVPFVKARSAGDPDRDPNLVVHRRLVALLGYPCDIYDEGRLVKVQAVAPVTPASRAGIPHDWDGAFNFVPLPDLWGDGEMYAIDLRVSANIDASYLTRDRRLRSMSELGWAMLRQRMALCATRALIQLPALAKIGSAAWAEVELWQLWCAAGLAEGEFHQWLTEHDPAFSGFTRAAMLERGMATAVRTSLEARLT